MASKNEFNLTGTLIWYYYCCPREVWLMVHQINPDEDDGNMDLGRFINENTYNRDKQKEISIGNIRLDIVRQERDGLVIGEVKKSSKYLKSARMQLAFYLRELKSRGLDAKGELLFPKEKRKEEVELTPELERELDMAAMEIERIAQQDTPPLLRKIPLCRNCAYKEFCWA
ncbi:MAG: CRISPR-associated protein Cas4 [Desulfitobacteriaceae bacterium]|nr:CRISPR-associated protein Cas4 [Desulfitobacteriaceae bacterium]